MSDIQTIAEMEMFFLALADKTRLRLLNLMRESEVCVYFFVEVLGENQPKISRHLAFLRNSGIVEARRQGKWMHYKIIEPVDNSKRWILQNTLAWLGSQEAMHNDYMRLAEICLSSNSSFDTSHAPKPNIFVEKNTSRNHNQKLETFLL